MTKYAEHHLWSAPSLGRIQSCAHMTLFVKHPSTICVFMATAVSLMNPPPHPPLLSSPRLPAVLPALWLAAVLWQMYADLCSCALTCRPGVNGMWVVTSRPGQKKGGPFTERSLWTLAHKSHTTELVHGVTHWPGFCVTYCTTDYFQGRNIATSACFYNYKIS